jgi:GDSL-like Lipase/Acylhydrolase family
MKSVVSLAVLLVAFAAGVVVVGWRSDIVKASKVRPGLQDTLVDNQSPHYRARLAFFRQTKGQADVVMLGDSLTEGVDWQEFFPDVQILNRGIAGDTSAGVLIRLDEVIGRRPKTVFLMIGINDLHMGVPISAISANIRLIVGALEQHQIRVVLQKTLYATATYRPQLNSTVDELNNAVSDLCRPPRVLCLNLNQILGEDGALSASFAVDGLHLNAAGYLAWKNAIKPLLP